jgi:Tol biopolymer transport system component
MPMVESFLEVMDLASCQRRIVYRTNEHIEAPNWTPDGRYFLVNGAGRLFRLPVTGGEMELIDTGPLNTLNNDHGISPDGKWIVISDKSQADGLSRMSILPAEGGTPRLVIPDGPSYWHGWSPDGKRLAYVGARGNRILNLFSCPVEGGAETRLSNGDWMDDGPDYSADGRYIYFNSTRSGNMKLWRMAADGSSPEQLTFEESTRDWFAHPSPDGKWIVFLSFGTDVAVKDHPPNKNVTLRAMPVSGGATEVIAEFFGGQGTINVPSWSPDGKSFAFVRYALR